jgi:hypothetical protein
VTKVFFDISIGGQPAGKKPFALAALCAKIDACESRASWYHRSQQIADPFLRFSIAGTIKMGLYDEVRKSLRAWRFCFRKARYSSVAASFPEHPFVCRNFGGARNLWAWWHY